MKKQQILLVFCIVFSFTGLFAQQEYKFTQYMYNGLALNPAYAGIHEGISLSAITRHQWVGFSDNFEGAPNTQTISIHSPINYRPISLGAFIYRDKIGTRETFNSYFSYAYRLKLVGNLKLSLGMQINMSQFINNLGELDKGSSAEVNDPNDPLFSRNFDNFFKFNVGSGFMVHSDKFYVGLAIPKLFKNNLSSRHIESDDLLERHIFATAGFVFGHPEYLLFKPNVMLKKVVAAPYQVDLNLNTLIGEFVWLGASYSWEDSFSGLVALQLNPQMQIGYALDYAITDVSLPSHEIMINYIFNLPTRKVLTPRYF